MGRHDHRAEGSFLAGLGWRAFVPSQWPLLAGVLVLLTSFVLSTVEGSSYVTAHGPIGSHDATAHRMAGPHMAGHDISEHDAAEHHVSAEQPCDHGHDCKCHDAVTASCCAQVTSMAAICTSVTGPSRATVSQRAYTDLPPPNSESIDPPTPPPRVPLC